MAKIIAVCGSPNGGKTTVAFKLAQEMANAEDITEQLKEQNQLEWVQRINNIRHRATEIVNAELIYV